MYVYKIVSNVCTRPVFAVVIIKCVLVRHSVWPFTLVAGDRSRIWQLNISVFWNPFLKEMPANGFPGSKYVVVPMGGRMRQRHWNSQCYQKGNIGYMVRGDWGGTRHIWNNEIKNHCKNGVNGIYVSAKISQPQTVAWWNDFPLPIWVKATYGTGNGGSRKGSTWLTFNSPVFDRIIGVCELTIKGNREDKGSGEVSRTS